MAKKILVILLIMAKSDVILNMINGDSNIAFFNALYQSGNFTKTV